jgi:hypothetical protein
MPIFALIFSVLPHEKRAMIKDLPVAYHVDIGAAGTKPADG